MRKFGKVNSCSKLRDKASRISKTSPPGSRSDGELVRLIIGGQRECFPILMDRHVGSVKNYLRMMVSNEADLDDLIQEVLLRAWLHLATVRSESNIRSWLISIGINHTRERYRRQKSRPVCQPLDDFAGFTSPAESQHRQLLRTEAAYAMRSAVAKLPEKLREVVVLHEFDELCLKETAERVHATVAAVKARLFRARGVLSIKLQGMGFGCEKKQRLVMQRSFR